MADTIYLACRNMQRALSAKKELEASTGRSIFKIVEVDVSDLGSVRRLLASFEGPVDALIMNAGGAGGTTPMAMTNDGVSYIFAQNVLGHAALLETGISRRTLYRAFLEILDDTPQGFIRRLRLHRIRHELVSGAGSVRGISAVARGWGAGADPGRMAARYRSLFGETPSATLAAQRERLSAESWL